jgi:hypothetical protein
MSASACSFCHEGGHKASKCPELHSDLWEGFSHENGATTRQVDDGEDDAVAPYSLSLSCLDMHLQSHTIPIMMPTTMSAIVPPSIVMLSYHED